MTPIQQLLLGVGAKKKTYMDDVFSTYLYTGDLASSRSITNNINLSGKGGLVWVKDREGSGNENHILTDTIRGANKQIYSDGDYAEGTNTGMITGFSATGFTVGNSSYTNETDEDFASWTFRKAKGFFDVVTYTGNGTAGRTVSHSLGSIPGCIMVKCTTDSRSWAVYHRGMGNGKAMPLNSNNTEHDSTTYWNDTDPTASVFTLGTANDTNKSGETYVAYLFAGGKGTTDKAVDFDGNDRLIISSTADLSPNDQDFTWEAWLYPDSWGSSFDSVYYNEPGGAGGFWLGAYNGDWVVRTGGTTNHLTITAPSTGQWTHVAVTRKGSTLKVFYNGEEKSSISNSTNWLTGITYICDDGGGSTFDGKVSNMRFVKGQSLYTTGFNVPNDPLTTTSQGAVASNVKLICCNGSAATSSTVTPSTITTNGDPTVTTNNSLFDDTSANVFGENEDRNVIKCGSYIGNGSSTGPEINLGWEPQWLLWKRADSGSSEDWHMVDSMRGIVTSGDAQLLYTNGKWTEGNGNFVDLTSTGFKPAASHAAVNADGGSYIFLAIRRPDGYVGKPADAGTGVFAIDQGNSSATQMFTSGFPVDFATEKFYTTGTFNWGATSRLTSKTYLYTNTSAAQTAYSSFTFDQMDGWGANNGWDSTAISYMWKRHAGFDVVTYKGNGTAGHVIPHSMNKSVEMMWVKNRGDTDPWFVWHHGLNGGTNPEQYSLEFNNAAEASISYMNNVAPTSTHFTVGSHGMVNNNNADYMSLLFSSVDGISKVGYYDGASGASTITTGFSPRFILIKRADSTGNWRVFDTARGWTQTSPSADCYLDLNSNNSQNCNDDWGYSTSTGFVIADNTTTGASGGEYIYYAHA